jgi:competence protein ComGF
MFDLLREPLQEQGFREGQLTRPLPLKCRGVVLEFKYMQSKEEERQRCREADRQCRTPLIFHSTHYFCDNLNSYLCRCNINQKLTEGQRDRWAEGQG